jgi:hypothetical protein
MKKLRWQHWILIGAFASIGYVFVMVLAVALTVE